MNCANSNTETLIYPLRFRYLVLQWPIQLSYFNMRRSKTNTLHEGSLPVPGSKPSLTTMHKSRISNLILKRSPPKTSRVSLIEQARRKLILTNGGPQNESSKQGVF